jgi:hypothetical protein
MQSVLMTPVSSSDAGEWDVLTSAATAHTDDLRGALAAAEARGGELSATLLNAQSQLLAATTAVGALRRALHVRGCTTFVPGDTGFFACDLCSPADAFHGIVYGRGPYSQRSRLCAARQHAGVSRGEVFRVGERAVGGPYSAEWRAGSLAHGVQSDDMSVAQARYFRYDAGMTVEKL